MSRKQDKAAPDEAIHSQEEKKRALFLRQKELLDTFLATGAISQAQHDKSLNCLIEKMGIEHLTLSSKHND